MNCFIYPPNTLKKYKYAVTLSFYHGKLLLSRHKDRNTWETQGGHIEDGETPEQAAVRELQEESGAILFTIHPVCDYAAGEGALANGMMFAAIIEELGPMPENEMAEVGLFDMLPEHLTYPGITPVLYQYYVEQLALQKV